MSERGIYISYPTIHRCIIEYAPILNVRMKRHLRKTNDSWRMDETYIKVKGELVYLYNATGKYAATEYSIGEEQAWEILIKTQSTGKSNI